MGGVTSRIERAIKALEEGKLKEALYLTDKGGLERHNAWVREAARKALEDRENAKSYLLEARDKLQATITAPLDDTSFEGVEEMLKEPMQSKPKQEKSDEELYEECEECHVANAIVAATEVCEKHPQGPCLWISDRIDKEDIQPEEWLKVLREVRDESHGEAKREFDLILADLHEYFERRKSPLLEVLVKEEDRGTGSEGVNG